MIQILNVVNYNHPSGRHRTRTHEWMAQIHNENTTLYRMKATHNKISALNVHAIIDDHTFMNYYRIYHNITMALNTTLTRARARQPPW